jgi:hypothetical protein
MSAVKEVELQLEGLADMALVGSDDSIWLVVPLRWWDLATLLWWLFVPMDKKAKVMLTLGDKKKVKCKAVRVATKHVRVRGLIK